MTKAVPRSSFPQTGLQISIGEAKNALLRSGYLLENRIEAVLAGEGYYAQANVPYPDPATGKQRELDVHALKAFRAGPNDLDFIWPLLLIECINNPQPIAFMTKESELREMEFYRLKVAGVPTRIIDPERSGRWTLLAEYLGMSKYHHYCRGRIATQFCSFTRKKGDGEWMASHADEHADGFAKLTSALEYFRNDLLSNWEPPRKNERENINVEFFYPVVVVQGRLLDVRQAGKSLRAAEARWVQYCRSALVRTKERSYQVDVVTERFFPEYLGLIEGEMSKTARLLRRRHEHVLRAMAKLVRTARRFRSHERITEALEPDAYFLE
jgi:hypothetical protein